MLDEPEGSGGTLRYLRLAYTVSGTNPTVGKLTAGVGAGGAHQDNRIYPAAELG
jgi:hypothetical protein